MATQYVVMEYVMVMKITIHAQTIVYHLVNVLMVKFLTVMDQVNVGQNHGLAMVSLIVKTNSMVLI